MATKLALAPRLPGMLDALWSGDLKQPALPRQMNINLRRAQATDADEAAAVLRASISTLCVPDHGNVPELLERWLANKTPQIVGSWIRGPGRVMVAEGGGCIVGIGAALPSGEITLNYVLPAARFRGVSKAVLRDLETYLQSQGCTCGTLWCTRTAHRFYRAAGYVDAAEPHVENGFKSCPMVRNF